MIKIALLRNKNGRLKRYIYKEKTYNKLYNDYILINKKRENIKKYFSEKESNLYPFSPKVNINKNFFFSPLNKRNNTSFMKTFYSEDRAPMNQKLNFFRKSYHNGRNMNEDSYFSEENYKNNYNLSENEKNNNMNNMYPNRRRNALYKVNKDINNQIVTYLNNFDNNRGKFFPNNKLFNYINNNKDFNKIKENKKKLIFDNDSLFSFNDEKRPFYNNQSQNFFKRNYKNEISFQNKTERLSFIENKKSKNKNRKNKIIYGEANNYLNNLDKRNKSNNIQKEYDIKNKHTYSNKSLNPSSLGTEQAKTFYTNNLKSGNINSFSNRVKTPKTHFFKDIKMISGVNEYFYDFNSNDKKNNKGELSLQSLSDSKMMELANKYIIEDDNSSENYKMNNIIHNKKKYRNKSKI